MSTERTSEEAAPGELFARRVTVVTTFFLKIAGGVLALHEGFQSAPDSRVFIIAALMFTGGQLSQEALLATIDRFMGRGTGNGKS